LPRPRRMQLRIVGWIATAGMDQYKIFLAQDIDGVIDLFVGAHASRKHDRFAGLTGVDEQRIVRERSGSDFVSWNGELLDEINRRFVPTGSEPRDPSLLAKFSDLLVLLKTELEPAFKVTIRIAKRILTRLGEFLRRVNDLDGAFLELYGIPTRVFRGDDQVFSEIKASIMIYADLADQITWMPVAY
jgi:hypothetical protein